MQNIHLSIEEEAIANAALDKSIKKAKALNEAQPNGLLKRLVHGYINLVANANKTPHVDWIRKI